MIDNLGESGKRLLARAARISTEMHHDYVGTEHLFLGIAELGDPQLRRAFASQRVDIDEVAQAIRARIGTGPEEEGGEMTLTPRAAHVLELAAVLAAEHHGDTVEAPHILVGLLEEGSGIAARTLLDRGIDPSAVAAVLRTMLPDGDQPAARTTDRQGLDQAPDATKEDTPVGLDTYPSRTPGGIDLTPEDRAAFDGLDLPLCEWGSSGSFRGKVYEDLVGRVAKDASLYQEWIPPEEVAALATAFEACDPEAVAQASQADYYPATADEVRALRHLLRLCANRGLGLYGDI